MMMIQHCVFLYLRVARVTTLVVSTRQARREYGRIMISNYTTWEWQFSHEQTTIAFWSKHIGRCKQQQRLSPVYKTKDAASSPPFLNWIYRKIASKGTDGCCNATTGLPANTGSGPAGFASSPPPKKFILIAINRYYILRVS